MDVTILHGVSASPKAPVNDGLTKTICVVVATRKEQKIKRHHSADNWHIYLTNAISRDDREGGVRRFSNLS
jgi:hypothetical protein